MFHQPRKISLNEKEKSTEEKQATVASLGSMKIPPTPMACIIAIHKFEYFLNNSVSCLCHWEKLDINLSTNTNSTMCIPLGIATDFLVWCSQQRVVTSCLLQAQKRSPRFFMLFQENMMGLTKPDTPCTHAWRNNIPAWNKQQQLCDIEFRNRLPDVIANN